MYEESLVFNNKPLRELTLEESMDYEKAVLKKILAADKAGMTMGLIDQMQAVLSIIKGIPFFLPISATSLIGKTRRYGFGQDSP